MDGGERMWMGVFNIWNPSDWDGEFFSNCFTPRISSEGSSAGENVLLGFLKTISL